jgi:hypothetical protein
VEANRSPGSSVRDFVPGPSPQAHDEGLFGQGVELRLEGIVAEAGGFAALRRAPAYMDQAQNQDYARREALRVRSH